MHATLLKVRRLVALASSTDMVAPSEECEQVDLQAFVGAMAEIADAIADRLPKTEQAISLLHHGWALSRGAQQ